MRVVETFESIQGEGRYAGYPCLFIRLGGCTRNCSFCDTKYHTNFKKKSVTSMINLINKSKKKIVVWTGGEPTLQIEDIKEVMRQTSLKEHHIETNGDINIHDDYYLFDYVTISPKEIKSMPKYCKSFMDIKVVTDGKLNKNMISQATMLMPLTTFNKADDDYIQKTVWNLCVKLNKRFCLRQHYVVWGKKQAV